MSWRLTFLAAVAVVAIASVAIAAQGGGSKNVVLCANKRGGDLSLAAKGKCGKGQRKLVISKQGPQGAPGPRGEQGAQGVPGAPGTTASIQPEAVRAVGPVSAAGCEDAPGTFCGSEGLNWTNGSSTYAPVGYWKDAGGEVHLMGATKGSAGAITNDLFFLPEEYRPAGLRQFAVPNCHVEMITVQIEASGAVHTPYVPTDYCVSLDGISFRP